MKKVDLNNDDLTIIITRHNNKESVSSIAKDYHICPNRLMKILRSNGIVPHTGGSKVQSTTERKCSCCKIIKLLKEFDNDKSVLLGKSYICRECRPKLRIRHKYKLEYEEYESLLTQQRNVCKICNSAINGVRNKSRKRLGIDHNHTNENIRGLLCASCNSGLGMFGDSIQYLSNAIKYLQESSRC